METVDVGFMFGGCISYFCCCTSWKSSLHNDMKPLTNGKYMLFPRIAMGSLVKSTMTEHEKYDRVLTEDDVRLIAQIKNAVHADEAYLSSCSGQCAQSGLCFCCCGKSFWDFEFPKLTKSVKNREIRFRQGNTDGGRVNAIEFDLHGPPRTDLAEPTADKKLDGNWLNKLTFFISLGEIYNNALLTDSELAQATEIVEKLKKTNIYGKRNSFVPWVMCWPCMICCCCCHYNNVYFTELRELEKTFPEGYKITGKCDLPGMLGSSQLTYFGRYAFAPSSSSSSSPAALAVRPPEKSSSSRKKVTPTTTVMQR